MKRKFYLFFLIACILLFLSSAAFSQLKPQTLQQIEKLMAEKQSRTPLERKISSQLLQAARELHGLPMTQGVQLRPIKLSTDLAGYLEVDINATVTNNLLAQIKSAGGKVVFSSVQFHAIRAKVALASVTAIAAFSEVKSIRPAAQARSLGAGAGLKTASPAANYNANTVGLKFTVQQPGFKERVAKVKQQLQKYLMVLGTGSVGSQGDHTMGADSARAKYGYAGQGVRIGVLNTSYNALKGAAADIKTGDLPGVGNPLGNTTPVTVVQDDTAAGHGQTDEGRAMLQIIHDLAPKAQLFFASSSFGPANFANNILKLRSAPNNCDIIIDDVEYTDEPPFQDGIIAQAVNTVTANGAMYFSSAGNQGSGLNLNAGVWENDFNDAGSNSYTIGGKAGTINNFGTAQAPIYADPILNPPSIITLFWADPLGASGNDYDLFVTDAAGNIRYSSTDVQNGSQDPFEGLLYTTPASGDQVVIFKTAAAKKVAISLHADLDDGAASIEYITNAETHGHSCAANAFCVAATPTNAAYPGIFTAADKVENFSSDGPRRIFFNADGTAVTPGNFLFATGGGLQRNKPDITAADGVSTTFTLNGGLNPFYGTSAAAPHAGAIAALLKSAKPSLTSAQIRTLLTSTALDIQAPGWDINSGYGIIQALKAMQSLNPCVLAVTKTVTLNGCNSVVYKNKTYTASTVVRDTVKTAKGCDSIYNVATIVINKVTPVTKPVTLTGCNSIVYKTKTYTSSTVVRDTVRTAQGCDSLYNVATITIVHITPVTKPITLTGCTSVVYKSKTYTTSTVVRDTVRTTQGCDSIYNVATITIANITPVTKAVTVTGCQSVVYKSKTYTASTVVRDTVRSKQGCDSIYNVATITVGSKPNLGKDTTVYVCAGSTRSIANIYNTAGYASVVWNTANPAAVGTGKDSLVVTTTAGCRDTAVVTVAANAAPAKPAVTKTGSTSFCLGDSLVATTTATGLLHWLRNGDTIKYAAATNRYVVRLSGRYKLKVTNTVGCSTLSDSFTVAVTAVPAPTITMVNDTLVSSAATGNQWFEDNTAIHGATLPKFVPHNIDVYTVQATVAGCVSPMSAQFFYYAGTNIVRKNTGSLSVRLFPNPAIDAAKVEINGARGNVQVVLTDLEGRKLWQSPKVGNGMVTIPLQSFAQGTYIVTVGDGVYGRTFKLVKAK